MSLSPAHTGEGPLEDTGRRQLPANQEETNSTDTLILDLEPSKLGKSKLLLFKLWLVEFLSW